ncbi:hypothetical protein [Methylomonas methanica]|uniref:Uncharacterized protein n=1 Tax=Methylomonas methanica TaxID=421 RepID=A0A177LWI0_METMH|nr:hypothetical protein [Methylomonas methanica]OAH97856.1 hypothetical protein A1353_22580 [Methylomonas methanica]OAI09662.1 hypothetical protein A1332_24325 [Methylomonas methanica]
MATISKSFFNSAAFNSKVMVLIVGLIAFNNATALQKTTVLNSAATGQFISVGPTIDPGVYPVQDFTLGSPSPTTVGLRWFNQQAPQTQVIRSINGSAWQTIQTFAALPDNKYASFLDENASANAENCYAIIVSDATGSGASLTSPQRCYITRDGRDELVVHRLQLRIRVPDVKNAGTDNGVEVLLQTPTGLVTTVTNWYPRGNHTWLDSTDDDLERGTNKTYDLMLNNISQASDITLISLRKPGNDSVCIAEFELLIDGQSAFQKNFGTSQAPCQWLNSNNQLTAFRSEIRSSSAWNNLDLPFFFGIDGDWLRSRIEATFGHSLHGKGELRNGSTTTSRFVSESKLAMSVPIIVHDASILGDVDSTVHFDLVLSPTEDANGDPVTKLSIENIDADSFDLAAVLLPVVSPILYGVSTTIEGQVQQFAPVIIGDVPAGTHPCFSPEGGIRVCSGSSPRQVEAAVLTKGRSITADRLTQP